MFKALISSQGCEKPKAY